MLPKKGEVDEGLRYRSDGGLCAAVSESSSPLAGSTHLMVRATPKCVPRELVPLLLPSKLWVLYSANIIRRVRYLSTNRTTYAKQRSQRCRAYKRKSVYGSQLNAELKAPVVVHAMRSVLLRMRRRICRIMILEQHHLLQGERTSSRISSYSLHASLYSAFRRVY